MSAPRLTNEQRQVLAHKVVSMNRKPAELMDFLMPLALFDRSADRMRRVSLRVSIAALIGLIIGAFVFLGPLAGPLSWPILGALLALCIGAFVNYRRLAGIDLSNSLRSFVFPVLAVLREETAADERVRIKLDLRKPAIKEKKARETAPYSEGGYHKVIDSFYVDPWFEGSTVLADHSKLRWSIVDHIRERKKTKRNPRGKIKTKTKYSRKTAMEVELALPERKYGVLGEGVAVEHAGKRNVLRFERVLKSDNLDPLEPHAFIDLVAEAYRHAVPAKQVGA